MQNWHTINAQRRRYINYSTTMLNRDLRNIRNTFKQAVVDLGSAEAALSSISESNVRQSVEKSFIEMYQMTGVAFAKSAVATLQKSAKMKLKAADPEILESEWLRYMRDFVIGKCGQKIQSVTRNILIDVENVTRQVVAEGAPLGWGPARVADEIFKRTGQRDKWRAVRIARTEVVGASNAGSHKGAGSFGIKLRKIWLVNLDGATRDDHAAMANAEHIGMEDRWQVGDDLMLHPHDPDASVENVVNCRCAVTHEPEQNIIDDILSGRFDPENLEIY